MATSAVCVTGLSVVDTGAYFTTAGQAFLLVLIQLGGLGMLTFTTVIILALGRRLSLRQETLITNVAESGPRVPPEVLLRDVLRFTLAIEAAGALLLLVAWGPRLGWREAAWPAVFHAVSAFCNAGFSTFSDSLVGFQRSPATLLVVGCWWSSAASASWCWRSCRCAGAARAPRGARASACTRASCSCRRPCCSARGGCCSACRSGRASSARCRSGTASSTRSSSASRRAPPASTPSTTAPRPTAPTSSPSCSCSSAARPGSTAGGIKTTAFALIALLAATRFAGEEVTRVRHRSIPEETVQRAVGLTAVAMVVVTASILVLSWGESPAVPGGSFLALMFEAVSAFNTVGLSMGVTDDLSPLGRALTLGLMFVGRVGPLTFAAALATSARRHRAAHRYAFEDVVVG
jgi:trk system potassium uptake protein TrkH